MKFNTIIADCPWSPSDSLSHSSVKRGAAANYNVMTTDQLCALPVQELADPNGCILGLWVLGSMLEDGMRVMKAWQFDHKQVYVFVKTKKTSSINNIVYTSFKKVYKSIENIKQPNVFVKELIDSSFEVGNWLLGFGLGHLFRQSHEICLIGINNTKIYKQIKNKSQRSVCFEENKGHSIKPDNLHESFEAMLPLSEFKHLEMFARRQRKGWTCIGNEVCDGEDISISLKKLIDG